MNFNACIGMCSGEGNAHGQQIQFTAISTTTLNNNLGDINSNDSDSLSYNSNGSMTHFLPHFCVLFSYSQTDCIVFFKCQTEFLINILYTELTSILRVVALELFHIHNL